MNDFETYQVAAGVRESLNLSTLTDGTVANGQGPALVEPGVSYADLTGSPLYWQGDGYAGMSTATLGAANTELWIDHFPFVDAIGFDLVSDPANPFVGDIVFFACPGGTVGVVSVDMTSGPSRVFVGWQNPGLCQIEIYATGASGPVSIDDYGYGVIPPLFDRYCTSTPNSSGQAAMIYADGSPSIAANDLTLRAEGVPSNQYGVFVFGTATDQSTFGNGIRCVMPAVTYLWGPRRANGTTLTRDVDLTAHGFQPGPYYFQCWFRDRLTMPAEFDSSDGISIDLVP